MARTLTSPLSCLHASNLLTYFSLMSAVASVAGAMHGSTAVAGVGIAGAVVADTFDGRFARLFRRDSERRAFGVQLDSLSDAAAFGIAPAVCLFLLVRPGDWRLEAACWLAMSLYAASAITRLGFYNVSCDESDGFIGLPVPVAALLVSSALLTTVTAGYAVALLVIAAAAMIAPCRVPRPAGAGLALFLLWPLGLIVAHGIR